MAVLSTFWNQDPFKFMGCICLLCRSGLSNKWFPHFPSIITPLLKNPGQLSHQVSHDLNLSDCVFLVVFDLFHSPPYLL